MSDRAVVAPRLSVAAVFFALGASAGCWAARIPAIKADLHLSAGTLGLDLLGPAIGAMIAMPVAGALLVSIPPRRIVQVGMLAVAGMQPLTTFAGSAWQLFLVLACWGAGSGVVDVAMNTEAAAVQDHLGRNIMSRFHAAYSIGGLVGAGSGAVAASWLVSARINFALAATVILAIGAGSAQLFRSRPAGAGLRPEQRSRWPSWSPALICLALIAFGSFLAEGAAGDWSAVYLHSSLGAGPGLAAIGYTVFSCAMVAGRLAGDRLTDWAGPVRLVRVSAGIASASFLAALVIGRVASGLVGFAMLGAGLAAIVPVTFTAASRLGVPGPNLSVVNSTGYVGTLAGPALIGGLAEVVGLPAALGTIVLITAMTAIMAGSVRPRRSSVVSVPDPASLP